VWMPPSERAAGPVLMDTLGDLPYNVEKIADGTAIREVFIRSRST
jgi:hypothetical protein